jgi:hypothetical protein
VGVKEVPLPPLPEVPYDEIVPMFDVMVVPDAPPIVITVPALMVEPVLLFQYIIWLLDVFAFAELLELLLLLLKVLNENFMVVPVDIFTQHTKAKPMFTLVDAYELVLNPTTDRSPWAKVVWATDR